MVTIRAMRLLTSRRGKLFTDDHTLEKKVCDIVFLSQLIVNFPALNGLHFFWIEGCPAFNEIQFQPQPHQPMFLMNIALC
jgi:hypothetical protein